MFRMILAAAAALALAIAAPALACPDCHDCPMHKAKVASAEKADKEGKKDAEKKVACACHEGKGCKCEKCDCAKKPDKKDTGAHKS